MLNKSIRKLLIFTPLLSCLSTLNVHSNPLKTDILLSKISAYDALVSNSGTRLIVNLDGCTPDQSNTGDFIVRKVFFSTLEGIEADVTINGIEQSFFYLNNSYSSPVFDNQTSIGHRSVKVSAETALVELSVIDKKATDPKDKQPDFYSWTCKIEALTVL